MADRSVSEGEKGERQPLDANINMLPMSDRLLCPIAFLLLTAMWSTMTRAETNANLSGQLDSKNPVVTSADEPWLRVSMRDDRFMLAWRRGHSLEIDFTVPKRCALVNAGTPGEQVHMLQRPGRRLLKGVRRPFARTKAAGAGRRSVNVSLNQISVVDVLLIIVVILLMRFTSGVETPPSKTVAVPSVSAPLDG